MNDIIAIHGLKGSGKDTVANMILKYRPEMQRWAFGDKLKRICIQAYNLPHHIFFDEKFKEEPLTGITCWADNTATPRKLLTDMADTLKKAYGVDFFSDELLKVVKTHPGVSLIVTDLRAYNGEERHAVDAVKAKVLHVLRPKDSLPYQDYSHSSEQPLPIKDKDYVIHNDGTMHDLLLKVRQTIMDMYGRPALDAYPYVPPPP